MPGLTAELPAVVGDSPVQQTTSSAESNFRELDDAFLQTQARIWVGEVLQIRFDEQMSISDLLADGELLFEVSEVISRMLPILFVDETQLKVYERKSLPSNKSTRRYMPYYNVDSFLRMCKNLGVDGIDLFTPSDVVERRNTRKVCMCLRSLSKKTRLKDLNVPDFDSVTCTLAMPTDMVGCIRKSLEMSQSSSSPKQEGEKVSRVRFWRRMSNSASAVSNGYSDNCDEAESRLMVAESYGSSDYAEAESPIISGSQLIGEHNLALQLSMRDFKDEDDDQCEYLSPSNAESVGSPCSQYYSDEELSVPSSNCLGSRISGKVSELDSETNNGYRTSDVSHVPIDWRNSHLDVVNHKDGNAIDDEVDNVSPDIEDVDTTFSHVFHLTGNDTCNGHHETLNCPTKVDCDKISELEEHYKCVVIDEFHIDEVPRLSHEDSPSDNGVAKHESSACVVRPNIAKPYNHAKTNDKDIPLDPLVQSCYISEPSEDPDNSCNRESHGSKACTEVTNVGVTYCYSLVNENGRSSSEDLAGQMNVDEEQSPHLSLLAVKSNPERIAAQSASPFPLLSDKDTITCEDVPCSRIENDNMITPDHAEHPANGFVGGHASNSLDMLHVDRKFSSFKVVANNNTIGSENFHGAMEGSEGHHDMGEDVDAKPINIEDTILVTATTISLCNPQPDVQSLENFEETSHKNNQCVKELKGESDFVEQKDKEIPLHKPQRKLLKSVVKGTALVGIAVFLLHLRKSRRENPSEAKKQPTIIIKQVAPKPSQKGQKGASSIYPAEKLHLGESLLKQFKWFSEAVINGASFSTHASLPALQVTCCKGQPPPAVTLLRTLATIVSLMVLSKRPLLLKLSAK